MRELVECLLDWLARNRSDVGAHSLLSALANETHKKLGSNDAAQREFDAQQLAAAAQRIEADDYDASKRWVDRSKLETFVQARAGGIEEHFRACGHLEALRPARRSPGGKYRAVWFLEPYALSEPTAEQTATPATGPSANQAERVGIVYDFTPPGQVKPAWYAQPLIGGGSFVTRSWRGLLWLATVLVPIAYLALTAVTAMGYAYVTRPVQTSDLASAVLLGILAWAIWRLFVRPTVWLVDDRIVPATELFVAWGEKDAQLELATESGSRRRLQLVRYSAVCPICAGNIELRYAHGQNRRRLVGCCDEAPHEHIFSFDRVSRCGRQLLKDRP